MSLDLSDGAELALANFADFRRLREQGLLCDIVLESVTTDNAVQQISAHKVVLAAVSPYFEAMFTTSLSERTRESIFIHGIEPDILHAVVSFIYKDEIDLPYDRFIKLLMAADMFQILSLRQKCITFLQNHLQHDKCFGVRTVADTLNCHELSDFCTAYARTNFEKVVSCFEYLSLTCREIKDLISSDKVCVTKEDQVYNAVSKWVHHDFNGRKVEFPDIISYVRLPFVSTEFLHQVVDSDYLMQTDTQCQEYLHEAYAFKNVRKNTCMRNEEQRRLKHGKHYSKFVRNNACICEIKDSSRIRPRKILGIDDMFITLGGRGVNCGIHVVMEKYDPATDNWTLSERLPVPKYETCACYLSGYVYVIGGCIRRTRCTSSVERYNLREDIWENVMPMTMPRMNHSVGVLYGHIYVTGGVSTGGRILSQTECYYPEANIWEKRADMNFPRADHGMTDMNIYLFAAGGHNRTEITDTAELYNPCTNVWTAVSPMSHPRYGLRLAYLRDKVYAVGGENSDGAYNNVESYDMKKNQWTSCMPLNHPRSFLGLVKYEDNLYACGGFNKRACNIVEKFNPTLNHWKKCTNMNILRTGFGIISTSL